jgi:Spy/CpxP family protein refolding chaperone
MKTLLVSMVVSGAVMFVASAQAMTVAPVDPDQVSRITRVAGGCGPGWHRGPYGGCRPMYNCPPGWHSGPFGRHCFRNW